MQYEVRRAIRGTVHMSDGHDEPATMAHIYADGRYTTSVSLNGLLLGGSVYGIDATNEQIIAGVLGDEDIFTGAPAFPQHHDTVTRPRPSPR